MADTNVTATTGTTQGNQTVPNPSTVDANAPIIANTPQQVGEAVGTAIAAHAAQTQGAASTAPISPTPAAPTTPTPATSSVASTAAIPTTPAPTPSATTGTNTPNGGMTISPDIQKQIEAHNQQIADSYATGNLDVAHMGTTNLRNNILENLKRQGVNTDINSPVYQQVTDRVTDIQNRIRSKVPQFTSDQYYQGIMKGETFNNVQNPQLTKAMQRASTVQAYSTMSNGEVSTAITQGKILIGGQTWHDLQANGQGNKLSQALLLHNTGIANNIQNRLIGASQVDTNTSITSQKSKVEDITPNYMEAAEKNVTQGMPATAMDAYTQYVQNNPQIKSQAQVVAEAQKKVLGLNNLVSNAENAVRASVISGGQTQGMVLSLASEQARSLTPAIQAAQQEYSVAAGLYEKYLDLAKGQFEAFNYERQYQVSKAAQQDVSTIEDTLGNKYQVVYNKLTGERTMTPIGANIDINGNISNTGGGGQGAMGDGSTGSDLFATLRAGNANGKKFFGVYATGDPTGQRGAQIYTSIEKQGLANFVQQAQAKGSKITLDMINNSAEKYGVDPIMIAATMQQDSSMGTAGLGSRNNNPGNVGQFDSLGTKGVKGYATLQGGVDAVAENLAKRLNAYNGNKGTQGGNTIDDMINKIKSYQMKIDDITIPGIKKAVQLRLQGDSEYNPTNYDVVHPLVVAQEPLTVKATTALSHLQEFVKAAEGNWANQPIINALAQKVGTQLGSDKEANLKAIATRLAGELSAAFGGGALGDRVDQQSIIDITSNPAKAKSVGATQAQLLLESLNSFNSSIKGYTNSDYSGFKNNSELNKGLGYFGLSGQWNGDISSVGAPGNVGGGTNTNFTGTGRIK